MPAATWHDRLAICLAGAACGALAMAAAAAGTSMYLARPYDPAILVLAAVVNVATTVMWVFAPSLRRAAVGSVGVLDLIVGVVSLGQPVARYVGGSQPIVVDFFPYAFLALSGAGSVMLVAALVRGSRPRTASS